MIKFAVTVLELYDALKRRNRCSVCGGSGIVHVEEAGMIEHEPCECVELAYAVLKKYQLLYEDAVDLQKWEEGT